MLKKQTMLKLDAILFDTLDLTQDERGQVYESLEYLSKTRRERKKVKVLVETGEEYNPPKRHKTQEIETKELSERLDMWRRYGYLKVF